MKRVLIFCASAVMAAAAFASASAQAEESRYIVMFNKHELPADVEMQISAAGGKLVRSLPQVGIAVAVSSDPNFAANASGISGVFGSGPSVPTAVPETVSQAVADGPTAADDLFNVGLVWGVERVGAPVAWDNGHTGSHDTVVAIIDTGIATNHPDLAPNIVYTDCYTSAGSQADGVCKQYPSLSDHGTHTAGTAAAAFDGGRVVGVGPNLGLAGYNVFEVIPGCGVCAFSDSRWAAMIDAADRGFDVISMSLGGTGQYGFGRSDGLAVFVAAEKRVANYVQQQGTVMVASAGNAALNLSGNIVHVPGDTAGIVNVSATGIRPNPRFEPGSSDVLAFYSNYGAPVTLAGPGGDCGEDNGCSGSLPNWFEYLVMSTIVFINPACAAAENCFPWYGWKGGTSMATPHVSGAAGLVKDANPNLSAYQVQAIIQSTAENLGDRQEFGHGMVDVPAAVSKAN